ncbi:MAG TPA: helix-turn-helix domain-containing protein [Longimicrobiales bacterium]
MRAGAAGPEGLAHVGLMLGDASRAAMLTALLGGPALPAGELARRAGVSPSTASAHLAQLSATGLVVQRRSGRHRYYALSGPDVAEALEALARIAPPAEPDPALAPLRYARTCYDHLAGRLGVLLTDTMVDQGLLTRGCDVTAQGEEWLGMLGIDVAGLRRARRRFARPCLDWTERRDHLAGAVGAALTDLLLDRRWIVRLEGTRAVRLTVRGRDGLYRVLGLEPGPDASR